jgi:hypothetical protein
MASHFVGLARGVDGGNAADYLTGAATNAAATVEVRIDDGALYRLAELTWQLDRIKDFLVNAQQRVAAGVIVNG